MLLFQHWPGAKLWTTLTVIACAGILVSNGIYFDGGATPRFLLEKGDWARTPWWLAAFYFHVVGASLCLATGTPLMFPQWTMRHRAWHRRLGYAYLCAVLWMAAPSGMLLAFVAKGGFWGSLGFLLSAIAWWYTTWTGYRTIRAGDLPAHIRAMVRSYAWALSAPAFRISQIALYYVGLDDQTNYVASLWLSMAVSVCLAETYIQRRRFSAVSRLALSSSQTGVVT